MTRASDEHFDDVIRGHFVTITWSTSCGKLTPKTTQIHFSDPAFLSVELVEGTSVMTGPKRNKGPSIITFAPKCNKGFIGHDWDNMRHVHQTELEKKGTRKNTI